MKEVFNCKVNTRGKKLKVTLSLTSFISILYFHLFDLLREDYIRNDKSHGMWQSPWTLGDRVRSGQLNAECRWCWKNSVTKTSRREETHTDPLPLLMSLSCHIFVHFGFFFSEYRGNSFRVGFRKCLHELWYCAAGRDWCVAQWWCLFFTLLVCFF